MAALLRSARLLKFSPSGLLQVAGTKRSGPPLGRLYSGAPYGSRTGLFTRHIGPAPQNAFSRVLPYAVGCVRNCAVAKEQHYDVSMSVQSKQAQDFESALSKLDNSVRRTGRITKTLLLKVFKDICRTDHPSASQALLLLRSCGSLLPELPQAERTELAHSIWEKLQKLGATYDISHYNALLKVYLQNEFKFSPFDFLAKMEEADVKPNRVTYQRLIAAYCQYGDIDGASTILGVMKNKDLPITEAVFSSLIMGHTRAGDINSAKNILNVMNETGISPSPDTYVSLLNAYAETGDLTSLKETLEKTHTLMDRDILQIIFTLAKAGHHQFVPEMIKCLKLERGYIPDAMNVCLNLTTQGMDNVAFSILETFHTMQLNNYDSSQPSCGNFFIRHCVNIDMPLEKLAHYCKLLQESHMHDTPLNFALSCVLENKKTGMAIELMKIMKKQDLPIRPHYFWPLLTQHMKDANTAGVEEVLRGMHKLGLDADIQTLNSYILPVFPSVEDAQEALKTVGMNVNKEIFWASKIGKLAEQNLAEVYTMMSDPSITSFDWTIFRRSLIKAFKKFQDIESMVKITALMCNDTRFQKSNFRTTEEASFILYNLLDSMSEKDIHAKEEQLKRYFSQLQSENVILTANLHRGIMNLLESYNIPELIKVVAPLHSGHTGFHSDKKMLALKTRISELKAADQPIDSVLKQMINTYIEQEKPQAALNLMQEHKNEVTTSLYISLIRMCCRYNYVDQVLTLKKEMSLKDPTETLDFSRYLELVRLLTKNDRMEEALEMLKEMKEKDLTEHEMHNTSFFHIINSIAMKGDVSKVQQLQDTIFTLGLAKPSISLCSPLITVHLERKDLAGALEAMETIHKRFGFLPRMQDIIINLVEMGNTDLLQKALDFQSQRQGEMTMLYTLFFAFLQTGHYYEARKVIETPGLRARPARLQWYAEKCISSKQMKPLEEMVEMTVELFECDRDEMYSYMLRLCKETNNWQKAQEVWLKMKQENITPKERTLRILEEILKSNGQKVPFEVTETWYKEAADQEVIPAPAPASNSTADYRANLFNLCKKGKGKEAFELLKDAIEKDLSVQALHYDQVIRTLLANGLLEDALTAIDTAVFNVPGFTLKHIANNLLIVTYSKRGNTKEAFEKLKSMLKMKQTPSYLAITRLVRAMGNQGDLAGIQEVQSLLNDPNIAKMMFINNIAIAHIQNGNVESAVELLEEVFTNPENRNAGTSFVFKKVLEEDNDKALDKLSAMAERLANHFACYKPAADLFFQLVDMGKVEDAKFMLARLPALAEQKEALLFYVNRQSQTPGQLEKIKTALSLFPDVKKEVQYQYLLKCHAVDGDFSSAKALYEQIQKEGVTIDELSLKRLALLYRNAGETVPFTEPPNTFRFYSEKLKAQAGQE
ncbi:leucine-rich PPR motif-containing protein, mitochondrial [Dicentrarchus labrax]|uniref:Leucine rich pentatricopeptide repeat containing n=1 Tax=Dicentrarchus labrax TaxID=13489 RepID=A0A8C4NXJ6_DICLA|nr:leucine-rich PPR motif-containing protein, mitochondrial [Dicentrarchus labrax]